MHSDRPTQGLLALVALLLSWLAIRPYLSQAEVRAATSVVQYKVALVQGGGPGDLEPQLNNLGKDGWTLVSCPNGFGYCIFKK
jgi:hypothetical protein